MERNDLVAHEVLTRGKGARDLERPDAVRRDERLSCPLTAGVTRLCDLEPDFGSAWTPFCDVTRRLGKISNNGALREKMTVRLVTGESY